MEIEGERSEREGVSRRGSWERFVGDEVGWRKEEEKMRDIVAFLRICWLRFEDVVAG